MGWAVVELVVSQVDKFLKLTLIKTAYKQYSCNLPAGLNSLSVLELNICTLVCSDNGW